MSELKPTELKMVECQNGTFAVCPDCGVLMAKTVFDGWKCFGCGKSISKQKA